MGVMHKLNKLVFSHSLPKFFRNMLEILEIDLSGILTIIEVEYFLNPLLCLGVTHPSTDYLYELVEIDWSGFGVHIFDHGEDCLVSSV